MGGTESKPDYKLPPRLFSQQLEEINKLEKELHSQLELQSQLDSQFDSLKEEIHAVEPMIKDDVQSTVGVDEKYQILQYQDLVDIDKVSLDLEGKFEKCKGKAIIMESVVAALETMRDRGLKKVTRGQQHKRIQVLPGSDGKPDQVVGIEIHFKVIITEEGLMDGVMSRYIKIYHGIEINHKTTSVLVGYKILVHLMTLDPKGLLTKEEHKPQVAQQQPPPPSPEEINKLEKDLQSHLDSQFDNLRDEIDAVQPMIKDSVKSTVDEVQDCQILEYQDLADINKISLDLERTFGKCKGKAIIMELALAAMETMKDRKELKKVTRWQQRKRIQAVPGTGGKPDQVLGIEIHFKFIVIDEGIMDGILSKYYKKALGKELEHKKTIVFVGYKVLTHLMTLDPKDFMTKQEFDAVEY